MTERQKTERYCIYKCRKQRDGNTQLVQNKEDLYK